MQDLKVRVENSLAKALEYVLSCQESSGSWVEWRLPPGPSHTWTTAFVGYKLRLLPSALRKSASDVLARAGQWLAKAADSERGWAYNEHVEVDADTTAFAILFLSSLGISVADTSYHRLLEFQRSDGGFSTYQPRDSSDAWGKSHPDVTPGALLALLTKYQKGDDIIVQGLSYTLSQKTTQSGLWNSYWWDTPLYATALNLELLTSACPEVDRLQTSQTVLKLSPATMFEAGLLLSCYCYALDPAEDKVASVLELLLDNQQDDGSWPSGAILRVTRRDCDEPWSVVDPGAYFSDINRLFTTSSVIESFCKVGSLWPF
jgi:squalene cyclase